MPTPDLLNRNQRRHFEVLFAMLEDELERIERLARGDDAGRRLLTVVEDDATSDLAERLRPLLEEARGRVGELAEALALAPRRVSRRRSIHAALTAAIIRIDDSSPSEMRGYGAVSPRFDAEIGPWLRAIRESLAAMDAVLAESVSRRRARPREQP